MNLTRRIQKLEEEAGPKISFEVFETDEHAAAFLAREARAGITPPPGRYIVVDGVPDSPHLSGDSHAD